jgi:hypothetical protein
VAICRGGARPQLTHARRVCDPPRARHVCGFALRVVRLVAADWIVRLRARQRLAGRMALLLQLLQGWRWHLLSDASGGQDESECQHAQAPGHSHALLLHSIRDAATPRVGVHLTLLLQSAIERRYYVWDMRWAGLAAVC